MSLKDYIDNTNQCIINNHSEFIKLLKFFLKHGAKDCYGNDVAMFENIWDICDELDVKYEDYIYDGDDEEGGLLIKKVSELEKFLLQNINKDTLVPSEDEYPILVNWYKEESFDRIGNYGVKILNFTPMRKVYIIDDYLSVFMKELKVKNKKSREMCKLQKEYRNRNIK